VEMVLSLMESQPLSDGILSPGVKGVTLQKTDHRQADASKKAIPSNRVSCILRTGRFKAACTTKHGRQQKTVSIKDVESQRAHVTPPWTAEDEPVGEQRPIVASIPRTAGQAIHAWGKSAEHALACSPDRAVSRSREKSVLPCFVEPHCRTASLQ